MNSDMPIGQRPWEERLTGEPEQDSKLKMINYFLRNQCLCWLVLFTSFLAFDIPIHAQPPQTGMRLLSGHVPAIAARLTPINRMTASNQMHLSIGLPLRNQEALTNLLRDLYDPASPRYHQFLTPDEFTQNFGPTEQDYLAVSNFATAHGLTVTGTYSNRVLLDVSGSVAAVEKAFNVTLRVYQHPKETRTFFAPDVEPSVPANLLINNVGGLNNYVLPKPKLHRKATLTQAGTNAPAKVGSGPNNLGYMGNDFRAAYIPGVTNTGSGQAVALVEFDGYYANDITQYRSTAGLPMTNVITNVLLNGFNGQPSTGQNSGNTEVALDIEMVLAMAPGISKVFVYEQNYSTNASVAYGLLNRIATDNLAKQISCSWVTPVNAASDAVFQEYAAQGQSFFDASGDDGAYIGDIVQPSDDPYLTQVGGTFLATTGPGGAWLSETVWQRGGGVASSGGVSDLYAIPSWQQGFNMSGNMGSQTMRNFPDVAMVADDIFIVADNGQQESVGGTSCAAPLWAAFTALVNQQAAASGKGPIGFINPAIYNIALSSAYSANFHDITMGNDTNSICPSEFYAEPGYDLCTGLGTPIGNSLMNALLAPADALQILPLPGFTASGSAGGPFNITSQSYALTNAGNTSLNWNSATTASWLNISPASGKLTPHATTTVTVSLNTTASSLPAALYQGSAWFTNLSSSLGQSRQFALQVGQPLVENGGFETGDTSYWILAGDNGTYNFVDDGTITTGVPHSGTYFMTLGQVGLPLATLTQTIPTFPGQPYLLSFSWNNPDFGNGTIPNEFSVLWNGTTLFHQSDLPTVDSYTNFQFTVAASGTSSTLQFGFRNDNSIYGLDDVSVTPLPRPAFTSVNKTNQTVTLNWSALVGQTYQVQYKTNLLQTNWINLGSSINANSTTMTSTDSAASSVQRFYRVLMLL